MYIYIYIYIYIIMVIFCYKYICLMARKDGSLYYCKWIFAKVEFLQRRSPRRKVKGEIKMTCHLYPERKRESLYGKAKTIREANDPWRSLDSNNLNVYLVDAQVKSRRNSLPIENPSMAKDHANCQGVIQTCCNCSYFLKYTRESLPTYYLTSNRTQII